MLFCLVYFPWKECDGINITFQIGDYKFKPSGGNIDSLGWESIEHMLPYNKINSSKKKKKYFPSKFLWYYCFY